MNRIILIGNGFDLAHGLPTSYKDFINDYWHNSIKELIIEPVYQKIIDNIDIKIPNLSCLAFKPYITRLTNNQGKFCLNELKKQCEYFNTTIIPKNRFLWKISNSLQNDNWVDIESEYYERLLVCLDNSAGKNIFDNIDNLNKDFSLIQNALNNYLNSVINEFKVQLSDEIVDSIYDRFFEDDFTFVKKDFFSYKPFAVDPNIYPEKILYLTFNYTSLEKEYMGRAPLKFYSELPEETCVHMHGELNSNTNPMIFGYGDEITDKYKQIEDLNDNRYLANIKSIKYHDTTNYRYLLKYINSDFYQVYIFGMSCGLSDRTLLNKLFEHPNCLSIKPYFYQHKDGDNYTELVMNISRHFKDKNLLRERVVNKRYCKLLVSYKQ